MIFPRFGPSERKDFPSSGREQAGYSQWLQEVIESAKNENKRLTVYGGRFTGREEALLEPCGLNLAPFVISFTLLLYAVRPTPYAEFPPSSSLVTCHPSLFRV